MTDTLTPEHRSLLMSRVKGKNTKPEKKVRSLLHSMGYRFRLHRKELPGSPDLILPKYNIAIFVHGCFWHHHLNCKKATLPKQNRDYWEQKMNQNIERDLRKQKELEYLGWKVITLWQCNIDKSNEAELAETIEQEIKKSI